MTKQQTIKRLIKLAEQAHLDISYMIKTQPKAPEPRAMKPSQYKHILAWCSLHEIEPWIAKRLQRIAAREGAPIDAVFRGPDGWLDTGSVGVRTRMSLEVMLNKGVSR